MTKLYTHFWSIENTFVNFYEKVFKKRFGQIKLLDQIYYSFLNFETDWEKGLVDRKGQQKSVIQSDQIHF